MGHFALCEPESKVKMPPVSQFVHSSSQFAAWPDVADCNGTGISVSLHKDIHCLQPGKMLNTAVGIAFMSVCTQIFTVCLAFGRIAWPDGYGTMFLELHLQHNVNCT